MDYHGLSWTSMDYHGLSSWAMDYHGLMFRIIFHVDQSLTDGWTLELELYCD